MRTRVEGRKHINFHFEHRTDGFKIRSFISQLSRLDDVFSQLQQSLWKKWGGKTTHNRDNLNTIQSHDICQVSLKFRVNSQLATTTLIHGKLLSWYDISRSPFKRHSRNIQLSHTHRQRTVRYTLWTAMTVLARSLSLSPSPSLPLSLSLSLDIYTSTGISSFAGSVCLRMNVFVFVFLSLVSLSLHLSVCLVRFDQWI